MKFNKRFATILASALAITSGVPALAGENGSHADHRDLWIALQEAGISTHLNVEGVCDDDASGIYFYMKKALVVCQDNATGEAEVAWTANDYDTLRHEAQHVIQDCLKGGLADGESQLLFSDPKRFLAFVNGTIGEDTAQAVYDSYRDDDVSVEQSIMEIEAFAVADGAGADQIASGIRKFCF